MSSMPAGEFKSKCLKAMRSIAETGEPVTVTKHGRPVVQVIPEAAGPRRHSDVWPARSREKAISSRRSGTGGMRPMSERALLLDKHARSHDQFAGEGLVAVSVIRQVTDLVRGPAISCVRHAHIAPLGARGLQAGIADGGAGRVRWRGCARIGGAALPVPRRHLGASSA